MAAHTPKRLASYEVDKRQSGCRAKPRPRVCRAVPGHPAVPPMHKMHPSLDCFRSPTTIVDLTPAESPVNTSPLPIWPTSSKPVSGYLRCFRHSPEMYLIAGASRVMGLHRQIQIGRPLRLAIYRQLGCSFCRVPLKQACVGSGQCHPNSMPFSQQHGRGMH